MSPEETTDLGSIGSRGGMMENQKYDKGHGSWDYIEVCSGFGMDMVGVVKTMVPFWVRTLPGPTTSKRPPITASLLVASTMDSLQTMTPRLFWLAGFGKSVFSLNPQLMYVHFCCYPGRWSPASLLPQAIDKIPGTHEFSSKR